MHFTHTHTRTRTLRCAQHRHLRKGNLKFRAFKTSSNRLLFTSTASNEETKVFTLPKTRNEIVAIEQKVFVLHFLTRCEPNNNYRSTHPPLGVGRQAGRSKFDRWFDNNGDLLRVQTCEHSPNRSVEALKARTKKPQLF